MKILVSKNEKQILGAATLIAIVIMMTLPYTRFGSTTIGSLIERREYTEYYYANLSEDYNASVNYRVKAKIYSYIGELDNISKHIYIVEAVYSDKNELIYSDDSWTTEIELGEKSYIELNSGEQCYIELTNKKTSLN
jgi:hypothetical protein